MLGPALREGYWTPEDTYEDQGESKINEDIPRENNRFTGAVFKFDEEAFEGENLNYYYADSIALENDDKTYYRYISLAKNDYKNWANQNLNDLILCFQRAKVLSFVTDKTVGKGGGTIKITYNGKIYYFKFSSVISANTTVKLEVGDTLKLYLGEN
jgi:hypothetical protein